MGECLKHPRLLKVIEQLSEITEPHLKLSDD